MNIIDNWQTVARVTDPERLATWRDVFGGDTVPIKSIIPGIANLPDKMGVRIYEMDLQAISPEQRERLVKSIAKRFGLNADDVERDLDWMGVPILADDCIVSTTDPAFMANIL